MRKIYGEYASIKSQIKELQEKESAIKEKIIADMEKNETPKLETEFGKFNLSPRSFWSYSDEGKAEIAKIQKKEQATGKAQQKVTQVLTFK